MQAFDWAFLPYPGSILEQPEWLMDDLMVIQKRRNLLKELFERGSPSVGGGNLQVLAKKLQSEKS